jgi:hypothetical protein
VTSSYGLGEAVVQGQVVPDQFYVHKPTLRQGFRSLVWRTIGAKEQRMVYSSREGELVRLEPVPEELRARPSLKAAWEKELDALPADWSDVYAEVRLDSTDYVERAALHLSPINPRREDGATGLRFRSARVFGYGASPAVAARCFERCDEEGITGTVEVLRVLSDTDPVGTQGPVWYIGGRSV